MIIHNQVYLRFSNIIQGFVMNLHIETKTFTSRRPCICDGLTFTCSPRCSPWWFPFSPALVSCSWAWPCPDEEALDELSRSHRPFSNYFGALSKYKLYHLQKNTFILIDATLIVIVALI